MTLSSSSIDNGARAEVDCHNFTGTAGVRFFGDGGEFAAPRAQPSAVQEGSGTVDGRAVRILDVRRSDTTDGMIVVRFAWENR